jgi:ABC-type Na+ efflux pump permease subunit
MRAICNAANKDLRRYARDPLALLLWLGIPLMVGGMVSVVISGSDDKPPNIYLLIADEDGGRIGEFVTRAFGISDQGHFLQTENVTLEEGRARIGRGEATALLLIPKGFINAVLNEESTTLLLITNPSQQILPQMVEESLKLASDGSFYVHRLIGPQLRAITEHALQRDPNLTREEGSKISVAISEVVQRIEKRLFPPVIDVESSVDQEPAGKQPHLGALYLPGIVLMALIFMAEGLSEDLWNERSAGTLHRTACTPTSLGALLRGKLLASSLVILVSTLVVLLVGQLYYGLPLSRLPLAALWATLSGLVMLLFFIAIQLHSSTQRAGSILTNSIVMPLLFLGGSFFPFEIMPQWMATLGRWTPNGWALAHLKAILFGHESATGLTVASVVLLGFGAVLLLFGERWLRRAVTEA